MLIYAIVPRLPPNVDGVGDYALQLALQLQQDFGIETRFITGERGMAPDSEVAGFRVDRVTGSTAQDLLDLLPKQQPALVLLHYVGYGYAQRGCPLWLVNGLEQWRSTVPHAHLITMFHEIYATGAIWTSAFWLSKLQQQLAARLAQCSDRVLTNKQLYADRLYRLSRKQHTQIPVLPVFSNVGEPGQTPPLSERERRLVVFGSGNSRKRVYEQAIDALSQACQQLDIPTVLDIGPAMGIELPRIEGITLQSVGQQPAAVVSQLLSHSFAGFFYYATHFLAKSGIYAAYCAHGMLPVSAQLDAESADGIEAMQHFWVPDQEFIELNKLCKVQQIAQTAHQWYQAHNLSAQAQVFADYIQLLHKLI